MRIILLFILATIQGFGSDLPSGAPLSTKEWAQCEGYIKNNYGLLFPEGAILIPENHKLPCSLERDIESKALYINLDGKKGSFIGRGRNKIVTKSILYGSHPKLVARCSGKKSTVIAEGEILRALKGSRGIVHFHSLIQRDSTNIDLFIEYCNMGSLLDLKTKLNDKTLVRVVLDLFIGLKNVHDKGFIHRDIHPKNILVHKEKDSIRAVLADFGLSFGMQEHFDSRVSVPDITCSPEVLISEYRNIDRRKSEAYSLATVVYRLITGKYPHWSTLIHQENRHLISQNEKLKTYNLIEKQYLQAKKDDLKRFKGISKAILRICFSMMHPIPELRASLEVGIGQATSILLTENRASSSD